MAGKQIDFLEGLQLQRPELGQIFKRLAELYQAKLWHQLTLQLEEAIAQPEFQEGDLLIQLYNNFVSEIAQKINLLKLAHIVTAVAKQYADLGQACAFIEQVVETLREGRQPRSDQPILYLRMQIAQYKLQMGEVTSCRDSVQEGKRELDGMEEVDPSVSASVHYVGSQYYKYCKDYAEFYKSSLMYLAYVSSDSLPAEFKVALAVDISLAALLGENVYSFGELLQHPIVKSLDGTPFQWLQEFLECFNGGDLHKYDELCSTYASVLNAQPALVENERFLREKITIMSLLELIFTLPAENRIISLDTIAQRTKLSEDGVEFLLMRALSKHLVEGVIDQVDGTVSISWVQPRVLTIQQISGLKDRLGGWIGKVDQAAVILEEEAVGVE
uniref:26S proteasome regulatory subunit N9 n=1 Tax=Tetraselmis sp. GSL018 TaxID=582737 RepID=A0A061RB77_9CHLO